MISAGLDGSARHVYAALVVFSVAMLGAMAYVLHTSARVSAGHVPLVRASERLKLDATLAHLWFEEILSGDRHESMDEVWERLRTARFSARAMVEGGQDPDGAIIPLDDARLRRKIGEVEEKLSEFEAITRERESARSGAASGSDIDQQYDAVFGELIALADEVEGELHQVIRRDTASVRRVQLFVIAGAVILSILVGIVFARYVVARRNAEQTLKLKIRAEAEAREHLEKLAHIVRLNTMNELAAGIAHEINQPLAAISASAAACRRFVGSGRAGSEKHLAALELIGSEAERASDVLRRLRAFVSKRESRYELVDVNELVKNIVKLATLDSQTRDATIRLELAEGLPPAEADDVQIQQVLLNLVRNGLEAMEKPRPERDEIVVRTRAIEDDWIEVSVTDCGIGMPEEIEGETFLPFFTTKESGMGMGLSISSSIIATHGGRFWFCGNPDGEGTTFFFTLPAAEREGR